MSKKKRIANRKCSALLAAGTGAAVCLTGGGVHATNGMVSASNGATSVIGAAAGTVSTTFNLFNSKIAISFDSTLSILSGGPFGRLNVQGTGTSDFNIRTTTLFSNVQVFPHPAGVTVSSGMGPWGSGWVKVRRARRGEL